MKSWKIPVSWEMAALIEVSANTLEEAFKLAQDEDCVIPIPDNGEYVDGSWVVTEDIEFIRDAYN